MSAKVTDCAVYPQPEWNGPHSLSDALTSVAQACDKESSLRAYNDLLYAIGNNHAGTYYPVVLAVIPKVDEILLVGKAWPQYTVLEVLIDLCSCFQPELGHEAFQGEPLSLALRECVLSLKAHIELVANGTGIAADSARELLDCFNEKA
jgi:hypothetical protein